MMKRWLQFLCLIGVFSLSMVTLGCRGGENVANFHTAGESESMMETEMLGLQDQIPQDPDGYEISFPTLTQYTGKTLNIDLGDEKYGGPQFVGKLFSEGLGRGPSGNEYLYYIGLMETGGCNPETLYEITRQFFSARVFLDLHLEPSYEVMAIYRAVLNRDPSDKEIADYKIWRAEKDAAQIAADLTKTEEFSALLPDMLIGPYGWGKNNESYSPSNHVMTDDALQKLLFAASEKGDKTVALKQGTLVLVSSGILIPKGVTLKTEGNPTHYTMQARLLRVTPSTMRVLSVMEDATAAYLWVDGNRTAFKEADLNGGNTNANIGLVGNQASCIACRTNGATGGTNLFGADGVRELLIQGNLVTAYESNHHANWADGITVASTACLIENNTVIDATDVGIVLFRFVSKGYAEPQNSHIRNNKIINLGNSAYGGLDIDAWMNQGATQNFRGTLFENNVLWTSFCAHQHICLTMGTLAWHNTAGDGAVGGAMINNYTPEGLSVLCGAVFVADGCHDFVARGNHVNAYIGPWARADYSNQLRPRIASINPQTASGDLQGTYEPMKAWLDYQPLIVPHTAQPLQRTRLKEAIFHEDRVDTEQVLKENESEVS